MACLPRQRARAAVVPTTPIHPFSFDTRTVAGHPRAVSRSSGGGWPPRVASIRQDKQTPASVEADGDHGGVVRAVEPQLNRLIEIPHQTGLFQCGEMLLHQLSKLRTHGHDSVSMATYIRKRDARHDAARTHRHIVNIAALRTAEQK